MENVYKLKSSDINSMTVNTLRTTLTKINVLFTTKLNKSQLKELLIENIEKNKFELNLNS